MKTLVCANQKGGVGKTTILVHLAFYLAGKGANVGFLDIDHQANASYTLSDYGIGITLNKALKSPQDVLDKIRSHIPRHKIHLLNADENLLSLDDKSADSLAADLAEILRCYEKSSTDFVLIDTPPALVSRLAAALIICDFVFSPIELEIYSLQGIALMMTTIRNVRDLKNNKLAFLGMLPSRVDNRNPRHREHLKELNEAYPDLLMPLAISQRGSIADAVSSKIPVWQVKKTAARPAIKEMRALGDYILKKMEG
jgi:chromosome partitioning protein